MLEYHQYRQQAIDIPDAFIRQQVRASCTGFFKAVTPSILTTKTLESALRIKKSAEILDEYEVDNVTKIMVLTGLYILTWYEQAKSIGHLVDDALISICKQQLGVKTVSDIDKQQWQLSLHELGLFVGWLYHDKQIKTVFPENIQSTISVLKMNQKESMSFNVADWMRSWIW